jgi:phage-related protein
MAELTIPEVLQEYELPNRVELFEVTYMGTTYYFTNSLRTVDVYWNGNRYIPFPITLTGIGFTEDNNSTKPRLTLSFLGINAGDMGSLSLAAIPNLKGAKLTYILTFETYIFPNATANTALSLTKSHFTFANTVSRLEQQIIYELDGLLSFTSKRMFGRQILREGYTNLRFEGAGLSKQL